MPVSRALRSIFLSMIFSENRYPLFRIMLELFSSLPFEDRSTFDDRTHGHDILDGLVRDSHYIVGEHDHVGIFARLDRAGLVLGERVSRGGTRVEANRFLAADALSGTEDVAVLVLARHHHIDVDERAQQIDRV